MRARALFGSPASVLLPICLAEANVPNHQKFLSERWRTLHQSRPAASNIQSTPEATSIHLGSHFTKCSRACCHSTPPIRSNGFIVTLQDKHLNLLLARTMFPNHCPPLLSSFSPKAQRIAIKRPKV